MQTFKLLLLLSIFLFEPLFSSAQNGGSSGSFLLIGANPSAMAMGNAVSAAPEIGRFAFYNSAIVAGNNKRTLEMGTSSMAFDRALHMASINFKVPPSAGASITILNASVSNIDGRSQSGYPTREFNANDYMILGSFGVQSRPNLWLGAGLKFIFSDYHPDLSMTTSFGLDFGAFYRATEQLNFSFFIRDALLSTQWNSGELFDDNNSTQQTDYIPMKVGVGSAFKLLNNKLLITAEVLSIFYNSEFITREINASFNPPIVSTERKTSQNMYVQVQSGLRYIAHERFHAYLGYVNRDLSYAGQNGVSTGFKLLLPFDKYAPKIDYAATLEPNVGTFIHSFAFNFTF